MKKTLLFALASSLLIAPGAFAQSCDFEDLPSDHWAFQAVKKLCEKGIMQGFPDKTFKGQRNVTRYELAASLTKVMAQLEGIDLSKQTQEVKDMVENLKKDLKDQMESMKDEADKMRQDMMKEGEGLKDSILKSLSQVKFSGKVAPGFYVEQISGVKDKDGKEVSEGLLAVRPMLIAKLNINAPVYQDYVKAGLELMTGSAPYSSATAMGTDSWQKKVLSLNKAYLTWTPAKEFEMGFGKFASPFAQTYMTNDYDVSYEGMYLKPKFDWFTFTAGAFPLKLDDKEGYLAFGKSKFLVAGQMGFNFDFLHLNLGLFSYQNVDKDFSTGINGDGMTIGGFKDKIGADGKVVTGTDEKVVQEYDATKLRYNGFNVVDLNLGLHFDLGVPVCLHVNALKNLGGSFSNSEIGMPSAGYQKDKDGKYIDDKQAVLSDTDQKDPSKWLPNLGNTLGLMAGLKVGDLKKSGFALGFDYGMIGSDATIGIFNSSPPTLASSGTPAVAKNGNVLFTNMGTNVQYMKPYIEIGLADNVSLNATGWIVNKLSDIKGNDNPTIISTATYLSAEF